MSPREHIFGEWMLAAMRFGFGGYIAGNDRPAPEPKPEGSHGRSMAQNVAEQHDA